MEIRKFNEKRFDESFSDYLRRISPKGTLLAELWCGYGITYKFDLTKVEEKEALSFIKNTLKKDIFTYIHEEKDIRDFSVNSLLDQYNEDKIVCIDTYFEDKVDIERGSLFHRYH